MIRFSDVHKVFGKGATRVSAARGITLHVPVSQLCAVMGPSGSGKSTMLHIAAGLATPDSGRVSIAAREISRMTPAELTLMRRREIGVVFQSLNLLPYLTAWDNVALPLRLDAVPRDELAERVSRALERVDMTHRGRHKPHEMSGGEQQRVALARALVISPRLLLADEPTGNLDSLAGRQIMNLLRDINDATGVTMIVVTHDPVWAANCDRVVRLVDGRIGEDTPLSLDDRPQAGAERVASSRETATGSNRVSALR
ncbi:MAG: ABC transporter ATP-binding protein [Candidatus Binatia bacterium]